MREGSYTEGDDGKYHGVDGACVLTRANVIVFGVVAELCCIVLAKCRGQHAQSAYVCQGSLAREQIQLCLIYGK